MKFTFRKTLETNEENLIGWQRLHKGRSHKNKYRFNFQTSNNKIPFTHIKKNQKNPNSYKTIYEKTKKIELTGSNWKQSTKQQKEKCHNTKLMTENILLINFLRFYKLTRTRENSSYKKNTKKTGMVHKGIKICNLF